MHIHAIHHVAIICSDYAASKRFYVDILGGIILAETYRAERQSHKLDIRLGERDQIELFSFPDPPSRPSTPEAQGLRHLAFIVPDLDAAVAHLEAHHVACEPIRIDPLTGARFTFFRDPDSLPLELVEGG